MLSVRYSTIFKRDFKACEKRRYDMQLLKQVIDTLRIPEQLPAKNQTHKLTGDYVNYWECHIAPDWLLIYKQTADELFLYCLGTHADLF